MRKVDKILSKSFGPVVLYADELGRIRSILEKNGETWSLEADDVIYDSVEELKQELKGRPPKRVEVRGRKPSVRIELFPHKAELTVFSRSPESLWAYSQLTELLRERTRKPEFAYKLILLMGTSLVLTALSHINLFQPYYYFFMTLTAVLLVWTIWAVWIGTVHTGMVITKDKPIHNDFFERYGEKLLFAFIGATLSFFASYLLKKYF